MKERRQKDGRVAPFETLQKGLSSYRAQVKEKKNLKEETIDRQQMEKSLKARKICFPTPVMPRPAFNRVTFGV